MDTPPPCQWEGPPKLRVQQPRRQYKTLKYIGSFPKRTTLKEKQTPYHTTYSKHVSRLGPYFDSLSELGANKFAVVEPSLRNVNRTIQSFDDLKVDDFERDPLFLRSLDFLDWEYSSIFNDAVLSEEELVSYIDYSKSGGYTSTFNNIFTKGDLVKDKAYRSSDSHLCPEKTIPYTSVATKIEPKTIREIMEDKIRLFFVGDYALVKEQIRFGKRSSEKLKNFKWSAYGFNPYSGGVHDLATELLKKRVRFYYDVSGWDKFIPLMKHLFKWVKDKTIDQVPEGLMKRFLWAMEWSTKFMCVLYDGDVVLKEYGNASGSGTTTRDNILMHVVLAAMFLTEAYFLKNGTLPSFDLLSQQIVRLFGDDSVFAVDIEFSYVLENMDSEDGFLRSFFRRFGMKLKFLKGGIDYDIEQMEFLGFRFKHIYGYYFPYYDPERLACSFINTNDKKDTLEAYVSKCFTLTMMSFATEKCDLFLSAYAQLLKSIKTSSSPEIQSYVNMGPLNKKVLLEFYSGREVSFEDFVFNSRLEAEAENNTMSAKKEKFLTKLWQSGYLTADGKLWFDIATDPFGDYQREYAGYPDQQIGSSIVSRVQQQMTIKKPAGLGSGNWSCMICTFPWTNDFKDGGAVLNNSFFDLMDFKGNCIKRNFAGAPAYSQQLFPVTVFFALDDAPIGPFSSNAGYNKGMGVPSNFTNGNHRVVAWGLEVTDTTADIYKQGSCTVFKQNANATDPMTGMYIGTITSFDKNKDRELPQKILQRGSTEVTAVNDINNFSVFSYQTVPCPPKNLAEANLLPGTRTWAAKEGAYLVMTMNSPENPAKQPDSTQPFILNTDTVVQGSQTETAIPCIAPANYYPGFINNWPGISENLISQPDQYYDMVPYHQSGAYFTGLNDLTSLVITVNWYIEKLPGRSDTTLSVLARPSAQYDPFALMLYDHALRYMPVGVPVRENGFGTWFNDVINQISQYVTPIARAIGGSTGNMVAKASEGLTKASNNMKPKPPVAAKVVRVGNPAQVPPGQSVDLGPRRRRRRRPIQDDGWVEVSEKPSKKPRKKSRRKRKRSYSV